MSKTPVFTSLTDHGTTHWFDPEKVRKAYHTAAGTLYLTPKGNSVLYVEDKEYCGFSPGAFVLLTKAKAYALTSHPAHTFKEEHEL